MNGEGHANYNFTLILFRLFVSVEMSLPSAVLDVSANLCVVVDMLRQFERATADAKPILARFCLVQVLPSKSWADLASPSAVAIRSMMHTNVRLAPHSVGLSAAGEL